MFNDDDEPLVQRTIEEITGLVMNQQQQQTLSNNEQQTRSTGERACLMAAITSLNIDTKSDRLVSYRWFVS